MGMDYRFFILSVSISSSSSWKWIREILISILSVSSALHPSSLPDIYRHSLAPTLVSATYHIVPKAVIATQKQDKVIHADSAFIILIILLVRQIGQVGRCDQDGQGGSGIRVFSW